MAKCSICGHYFSHNLDDEEWQIYTCPRCSSPQPTIKSTNHKIVIKDDTTEEEEEMTVKKKIKCPNCKSINVSEYYVGPIGEKEFIIYWCFPCSKTFTHVSEETKEEGEEKEETPLKELAEPPEWFLNRCNNCESIVYVKAGEPTVCLACQSIDDSQVNGFSINNAKITIGDKIYGKKREEKYCPQCHSRNIILIDEHKVLFDGTHFCKECGVMSNIEETKEEREMKSNEYLELDRKINNESAARREQEQRLRNQLSRVGENVLDADLKNKINDLDCKVKTNTSMLDYHISSEFEPNAKKDKICPFESHLKEKKFKQVRLKREVYGYTGVLTIFLMLSMVIFYIIKFFTLMEFYRTGEILSLIGLTVVITLHSYYLRKFFKLIDILWMEEKEEGEERAKELVDKYGLKNYEKHLSDSEKSSRERKYRRDPWSATNLRSDTAD